MAHEGRRMPMRALGELTATDFAAAGSPDSSAAKRPVQAKGENTWLGAAASGAPVTFALVVSLC